MLTVLQFLDDPLFFTGVKRSIRDYMEMPGKGEVVKKRNYGSLVKTLPNQMYTSTEWLNEIKRRDKDSEADYVNEYLSEIKSMGGGGRVRVKRGITANFHDPVFKLFVFYTVFP